MQIGRQMAAREIEFTFATEKTVDRSPSQFYKLQKSELVREVKFTFATEKKRLIPLLYSFTCCKKLKINTLFLSENLSH